MIVVLAAAALAADSSSSSLAALAQAVAIGDVPTAAGLLQHDPSLAAATTPTGSTLLHVAASRGHDEPRQCGHHQRRLEPRDAAPAGTDMVTWPAPLRANPLLAT